MCRALPPTTGRLQHSFIQITATGGLFLSLL